MLDVDTEEQRKKSEAEMRRLSRPQSWNIYTPNNALLGMEKGIEEFMFLVAEHTREDLDKITVFRFYSLLDYIKNKNKDGGR